MSDQGYFENQKTKKPKNQKNKPQHQGVVGSRVLGFSLKALALSVGSRPR
jgi:hypothetical protein